MGLGQKAGRGHQPGGCHAAPRLSNRRSPAFSPVFLPLHCRGLAVPRLSVGFLMLGMGHRGGEGGLVSFHHGGPKPARTPRCPCGLWNTQLFVHSAGGGIVTWGELERISGCQCGQDGLQGKMKGIRIRWGKVWLAVGMWESRASCKIRGRGGHPRPPVPPSAFSVGVTQGSSSSPFATYGVLVSVLPSLCPQGPDSPKSERRTCWKGIQSRRQAPSCVLLLMSHRYLSALIKL